MDALITAITALLASSTVYTDVGGRIYFDEAPQYSEFPYIIFQIVTGTPDKSFTENCTEVILQFSIYSSMAVSLAEATTVFNNLIAALDDKQLTVTGYTLEWMRFQNLVTMRENVDIPDGSTISCRHWAVDFEIRMSLN